MKKLLEKNQLSTYLETDSKTFKLMLQRVSHTIVTVSLEPGCKPARMYTVHTVSFAL